MFKSPHFVLSLKPNTWPNQRPFFHWIYLSASWKDTAITKKANPMTSSTTSLMINNNIVTGLECSFCFYAHQCGSLNKKNSTTYHLLRLNMGVPPVQIEQISCCCCKKEKYDHDGHTSHQGYLRHGGSLKVLL